MFKQTVTYQDFNGKPHNEELYFHMMIPEWADLQFSPEFDGDLGSYIRQSMASGENQKVYVLFKLLVVNSYGRRSEDGSEFIKKPEYTEKFLNSPAWEQFFLWLTDQGGGNAQLFFNGIFPEALRERVEQQEQVLGGQKKLTEMTHAELVEALQKKTAANQA